MAANLQTGIIKQNVPGDYGKGETPDPIPNSEVKPFSAECTARVAGWENRTLPGQLLKASDRKIRGLFVFKPSPDYPVAANLQTGIIKQNVPGDYGKGERLAGKTGSSINL